MVAARLPVEDLEKHPQTPLLNRKSTPHKASAALELITDEAKKLRDEAEEHKINVAQTNAFVTHDDLDGSLVEQVAELQNDIQEKKRLQAETEKVLELAPKVELISQSLQSMPSQLPTTLDEQQTLLEDMEIKKQNLQNLISSMNDAPAAEELKQKSEWDLSRIKDLLQQLGSAVGDKLAALAAFNAARREAEEKLLTITADATDKPLTAEQAQADENAIAALEEHIKTLSVEELDENERREYADLLARLQNASQVLEKRRIEAEKLQQKQANEEAFQQTIVPIFNRLRRLVTEADEFLRDSDAVPGQYEPTARELNSEVELARKVINDAGVAADRKIDILDFLETTIGAAQQLVNGLEERASAWREFVAARDETDATLGKLRTPLERVLEKPKRSASEASDDMKEIRDASHDIQILNANVANLQRLSEALNPLESAYAEVRFADVDTEQTQKQYDELLNELATELEDDRRSEQCSTRKTPTTRLVLEGISQHQIPALKAQINLLQDRNVEAVATRAHIRQLEEAVESKIAAEMAEKEQLVLVRLVTEADEFLRDSDAVPGQYEPTARELNSEVELARKVINDAGVAADRKIDILDFLETTIGAAQQLVNGLEERASAWREFVAARDEIFENLETINGAVNGVLGRPLMSVTDGQSCLTELKEMIGIVEKVRDRKSDVEYLVSLLEPLSSSLHESRFISVHFEGTEGHLENMLDKINAELSAEIELLRTLDILTNELSQFKEDLRSQSVADQQSYFALLSDVVAHLENQKVVVARSEQSRQFVGSSTSMDLERLLAEARRLLMELQTQPGQELTSDEEEPKPGYDIDAAAEVLSALYPHQHPYHVLTEHGIDGLPSDSDSKSEFDTVESTSDGMLSPIPDDGVVDNEHLRRQRTRWRRVLRTALPLQAMLVLLLGAACLVPHCDDEYCCQLLNNFAKSFDPSLEFINGPPPF
ncbi:unnamed protein product [Caenorhabditis auriculariae]|uniref:KASH domain-containing protein n=1 Tax=Caenorhabditis auriculariae TaxID=2777116 RepID=A0A8S1GMA3_9PELO|nr:unnamed protein product [Caenorhabditis auriculariae]